MRTLWFLKFIAPALMLVVSSAYADIETWELKATVQANSSFTPTDFPQAGSNITVDYVINTSNPVGSYPEVAGITFSGFSSSNIWGGINWDGLHALNISVSGRPDGVVFVSFNDFTSGVSPDYISFLSLQSNDVTQHPTQTQIRFDFSNGSIYAAPTSFVEVSSVPESTSQCTMLVGLGMLSVWGLKRAKNSV